MPTAYQTGPHLLTIGIIQKIWSKPPTVNRIAMPDPLNLSDPAPSIRWITPASETAAAAAMYTPVRWLFVSPLVIKTPLAALVRVY